MVEKKSNKSSLGKASSKFKIKSGTQRYVKGDKSVRTSFTFCFLPPNRVFLYDFSSAPLGIKDVPVEEPTVVSPADGGIIVAVVEGSSTVRVVEDVVGAEAPTTTGMVVEPKAPATTGVVVEAKVRTAPDAAEASGQGDGSLVHHAGKEVVEDISPDSQEGAADEAGVEEEEECRFFEHSFRFFDPPTIVGSRAFRSLARVPHPKDIPNRGNVFDDECLEKVWWDRVQEIDELKNPTRVVSSFARTTLNVSTC